MRLIPICVPLLLAAAFLTAGCTGDCSIHAEVDPALNDYIAARLQEFDDIPADRRARLEEIAAFIASKRDAGGLSQLTFICTQNSRRSLMSQVWARVAADHFGIARVETFSGGTGSSAFNPRAAAALRRAGLRIEKIGEGDNPIYQVWTREDAAPLPAFSKVFDQAPNPQDGFCAVMTCGAADEACPIVPGAAARVAIPFEDPKAFDGTEREAEMYDARSRQIAREMLYAFSIL